MDEKSFTVRERSTRDSPDRRWIIVDSTTGEILDDAQGYGYKSKENALKAGWYKFGGGKEKIDATIKKANQFWKAHPSFRKKILQMQEDWMIEITLGEVNLDEEIENVVKEQGIVGYEKRFLAHLK